MLERAGLADFDREAAVIEPPGANGIPAKMCFEKRDRAATHQLVHPIDRLGSPASVARHRPAVRSAAPAHLAMSRAGQDEQASVRSRAVLERRASRPRVLVHEDRVPVVRAGDVEDRDLDRSERAVAVVVDDGVGRAQRDRRRHRA